MQAALRQAIARIERRTPPIAEDRGETLASERLTEELRSQATEELAKLFLHELQPLIGVLKSRAEQDIKTYAASGTAVAIKRIEDFMSAVRHLQEASTPPNVGEFNLTDLLYRLAAEHSHDVAVAQRDEPVFVQGDESLVAIAGRNVIQNAVEASQPPGAEETRPVVVSHGATDKDYWIAVLDDGAGLPTGWERAFEPGRSTKKTGEHFGLGLSIAKRAMDSMAGSIILTPRQPRGTSCVLRWPLPEVE